MTTTQIKQAGAASHVFGSTVSVTSGQPGLVDTTAGFISTDIGRTVTTTNTSGRKVSSVTDANHAVMDGNATGTSGPQTLTLAAALVNVTKKTNNYVDKTTTYLPTLAPGAAIQAQEALNTWINAGGSGTHATRCQKLLAAVGLVVQET